MTRTDVKLTVEGKDLFIESPYNKWFISEIKALRGKWDAERKAWKIRASRKDLVLSILFNIYSYTDEETIDVLIKAEDFELTSDRHNERYGKVMIGSDLYAYRNSRDEEVSLLNCEIDSVEDFDKIGGSAGHPMVRAKGTGVELECKVRKSVYEALSDEEKAKIEIL